MVALDRIRTRRERVSLLGLWVTRTAEVMEKAVVVVVEMEMEMRARVRLPPVLVLLLALLGIWRHLRTRLHRRRHHHNNRLLMERAIRRARLGPVRVQQREQRPTRLPTHLPLSMRLLQNNVGRKER